MRATLEVPDELHLVASGMIERHGGVVERPLQTRLQGVILSGAAEEPPLGVLDGGSFPLVAEHAGRRIDGDGLVPGIGHGPEDGQVAGDRSGMRTSTDRVSRTSTTLRGIMSA